MNPHETLSVVQAVKHVFHAERLLLRALEPDSNLPIAPIARIYFSALRDIYPDLRESTYQERPEMPIGKPRLVKKG